MARTPLFDLFSRALREAQVANRSEVPLEELKARAALNRRDFVKLGGAAAAGVAISRCVSPTLIGTRDPVVIVGGGIAGLTAAWRLQQAGLPVQLIEAQDRTGGRMFSLRDYFADGQVAELGGELIDTGHTSIRALATELGIELDDLAIEEPGIRGEVWYFDGAMRSEKEIVEALRPVAAAIERDLSRYVGENDVTWRSPGDAAVLDRQTIAEWLDRQGVSGWIRELLDVAYTTEFGLEIGEQSALNLLTMIDTSLDPFRIFGESDERFHVRGGNDLIVGALAGKVRPAITTGTVLESLRRASSGALQLSVRQNGASRTIIASRVVLALPFTMLREVDLQVAMPAAKLKAIRELGYGTNAKLMIGFNDRVWRYRDRTNGSTLSDLPFQLVWETSRKQNGRSGILTNFTGGRHGVEIGSGTDEEQSQRTISDLEKIYSGIAATAANRQARFHWPTFRWSKGSYATYLPGQWTTIRGVEGEPLTDVFFAGEHCSLDFQGFMEGGCETGERAAREVLQSFGIRDRAVA